MLLKIENAKGFDEKSPDEILLCVIDANIGVT